MAGRDAGFDDYSHAGTATENGVVIVGSTEGSLVNTTGGVDAFVVKFRD